MLLSGSRMSDRVTRRPAIERGRRVAAATVATLALALAPAMAQPNLAQAVGPTVAEPSSPASAAYRLEQWELDAADGARRYRVQLAVPRRAAPAGGFPVLYMLDGNAAFAALTADQLLALEREGTPPVIVAIGYATNLRFDTTARAYDYTPPMPGPGPTMDSGAHDRPAGGADIFLALIEQQIKPAVRERVAIDPARQSLWGHSYGGLFVLHALLRQPASFQRYIAADPSFWWQNGFILQEERQAAATAPGTCLLGMSGASAGNANNANNANPASAAAGQAPPPARAGIDPAAAQRMREARRAVPPETARLFVARQAQRDGLHATWREFEGASHGAMLGLSVGPALQVASSAPGASCTLP